jgi:hypothetical protein
MSDFTSMYLEAAILDQVVAGEFVGKDYAFVAVYSDGIPALGIAVANEPGYHPTTKKLHSYDEANKWADELNAHIGLSKDRASELIISTMGGRAYYKDWRNEK